MLERHRSGINPNTLGKSEQNRKEAIARSHLCTVSLLHTPAAEDGTFHWLIQFIIDYDDFLSLLDLLH
ncbi:hypothetical protein BLNAU_12466 [Blattamonas nauphoetae]|uniref:Uncharacterized protein n=1 Tax=Blattamonas nauphoetae TaxID=2049346 RepID=A0ABQ9XMT2_9EUKA|nr:hypothetical protein BLNAU_12466 [Blattamonas nauphoetae]